MLQRVFAGAHAAEEYSAAHNAAFSLARLYGHVTDKATLEVIRRPSRDPDAPSEQVLSDWVASLPVVGSSPAADGALEGPSRGVPAAPLGPEPLPVDSAADRSAQVAQGPEPQGPGPQSDLFNDVNGLDVTRGMEIGNGAPTRPVTGTLSACARSGLLAPAPSRRARPGLLENGSPFTDEGTTTPTGGDYPSAEQLF
jgi:hypothetical protein